ncbi:FtsW/RodA/SpoVE family cell cycle protein [Peptoniphilus sp. KCTC 25270]|uniref:FtsW/RodA/SpoVE family cell cycle protein n=1 Tax=Peptoniphilus sp. KCTC 25270 TaxID=2897414 RepID=UPI001E65C2AB|nr:FtsW/RodA/SpoVE family cell cycle protein [Peptoniphilus sp. KCTC 25270]MCD1147026.1 FtsW/RodA/SpoVE family cell cycle protein [Peptoniphilus sp. KCTC 25270]
MTSKIKNIRRPRDLLLLFEILAIVLIFFTFDGQFDRQMMFLAGGLIFIIYISNFILGKITTGDNYIFLIVSLLLTIGIITIFRINPETGIKQLQWSFIGILLFYLTYFFIRYFKNLHNLGSLYLIVSVALFFMTLIFGVVSGGAKNWLNIGIGTFQPTEFIKILLMFILASFYSSYEKYTKFKHTSYIMMAIVYFFVMLLFLQKDLGTAVMFLGMYMSIQFVYDRDKKSILVNIALLAVGAVLAYFLFGHVRNRVAIWLDPWSDVYNAGRQIAQSLFAIAEGGFFGSGIGFGYPELIPVSYSDFIFPVICEEMGILTGIGIIMLYILLTYRGVKIALEQEYTFYRILALSVSVLFALQSFLNIGGVIKLIPMTGITLPFISYGGSSMLSSFIALGILQVTSEDLSWKYERGE